MFKKVLLLSFISINFILAPKTNAVNGDILFSEKFDSSNNDIPSYWKRVDSDGFGTTNNFSVQNGRLGMSVGQQFRFGEIVAGQTSWTDYKYEFEMISFSGNDRNIIFRWQDEDHRLGFHLANGFLYLEKLIPSEEKGGPGILSQCRQLM